MSFLLPALLLVIFLACVGCLYSEGTWGNGVRLINVVTAALLATNFWEPTADWLEGIAPTYTYIWDFVALWVLFALFLNILRTLTSFLSRVKVRFLMLVDRIASGLLAVVVGWVVVCFALMTLHTAPLGEKFLFGGFDRDKDMFLGIAADRQWLGFVQQASRGSLCRLAEGHEFDPGGEFMNVYGQRRGDLQQQVASSHSVRTKSAQSTSASSEPSGPGPAEDAAGPPP